MFILLLIRGVYYPIIIANKTRGTVKFLSCIICLLVSCKQFSTTKHVLIDQQTLFDKLIAEAPEGKVPYPFSELIAYLSRYGKPLAVLLPLGRSLQSKAGYPNPFRDPRRLVTFVAGNDNQLSEFDLQSRLFLAYVDSAKQIEVISLSPGATKFDFQLVENYGNETKIISPEQSLCHACHRNAGPIFTPFPWEETNANLLNAQLIADHYLSGKIDGIDIIQEGADFFRFDQIIRDANQIMIDNRSWHSCATTSNPISCRKNLLQNTLAIVSGLANQVKANVTIQDFGSFLPDRNLFNLMGRELHDYRLTSDQQRLTELIADKEGKVLPSDPRLASEARKKIIIQYATVLLNNGLVTFTLEQRLMVRKFTDKQRTILDKFNNEQQTILKQALRQMLQHVHSKDLHLLKDSSLDPKRKFRQVESVEMNLFGHKFGRILSGNETVFNALQQHLTSNKLKTTITSVDLLITEKGIQRIVKRGGRQSGFFIDTEKSLGSCQNNRHCQLTGVPFFEGVPTATLVWQTPESSTTSTLTVDAGDGHHYLEFKCWSFRNQHYSCSIFDRDKVAQAINKMDDRFFDSSNFNEVAIIKQLLANLGYQLSTTSWKISLTDKFIDHDHSQLSNQESLHLLPAGQVMLKYCATCHADEVTPAPFLSASTIKDFCDDFNHYRQLIHTRVGDDTMPPPNSPQRQSFTDNDKKKLLEATKRGLEICR